MRIAGDTGHGVLDREEFQSRESVQRRIDERSRTISDVQQALSACPDGADGTVCRAEFSRMLTELLDEQASDIVAATNFPD